MAYRDFEGALAEQRRALIDEIEHLDAERELLQRKLRRRDELAARLRELDTLIGASASQPNSALPRRSLSGRARKHWLALAATALAAGGFAALAAASPDSVDEPPRSLLLMVKYVDRIGYEIHTGHDSMSYRGPADDHASW
jgi:hypothetical protein